MHLSAKLLNQLRRGETDSSQGALDLWLIAQGYCLINGKAQDHKVLGDPIM
jgi:hypothetical protein